MKDRRLEFCSCIKPPPQDISAQAVAPTLSATAEPWLFFRLGYRHPRTYRQDMCLGSRFIRVIEPNRAIRAEVIGVARLGKMTALDAVHSPSRNHLTLAINHQIDFFCTFVMVGEIRAPRRKVHPEEADDDM